MNTIKVWEWRKAIQESPLKPMTKLVLYTLANYMDEDGGSCFPNQEEIALGTGLDIRSISRHIKEAKEARYIEINKINIKGQRWKSNAYQARLHDTTVVDCPVVDCPVYDCGVRDCDYTTPVSVTTRHHSRINTPYNTSKKDKKKNIKKKKQATDKLIPDWLPKQDWDDWVAMRLEKGGKLTSRAKGMALRQLEDLRKSGNDPGKVLQQSIFYGWKGLFEVKNKDLNKKDYRDSLPSWRETS